MIGCGASHSLSESSLVYIYRFESCTKHSSTRVSYTMFDLFVLCCVVVGTKRSTRMPRCAVSCRGGIASHRIASHRPPDRPTDRPTDTHTRHTHTHPTDRHTHTRHHARCCCITRQQPQVGLAGTQRQSNTHTRERAHTNVATHFCVHSPPPHACVRVCVCVCVRARRPPRVSLPAHGVRVRSVVGTHRRRADSPDMLSSVAKVEKMVKDFSDLGIDLVIRGLLTRQ